MILNGSLARLLTLVILVIFKNTVLIKNIGKMVPRLFDLGTVNLLNFPSLHGHLNRMLIFLRIHGYLNRMVMAKAERDFPEMIILSTRETGDLLRGCGIIHGGREHASQIFSQ